MPRIPSHKIDDRAAEWAARLDRGQLSPEDQIALDSWLSEDVRHLGAFAKARAVSVRMDRARALGPGFESSFFEDGGVGGRLESGSWMVSRRQLVIGGGIAASAATVALTASTAWHFLGRGYYSTALGETRVLPMEDGSVVTLNTNSSVLVNYTKMRRDISLLQGEALFDVAKDKSRPFVVSASGTTVRAVGTSFAVALLDDKPLRILVREGTVEIKLPIAQDRSVVRVGAGTRAVVPSNKPLVARRVAMAEVNRELAWHIGRLAFEGQTLREAADAFARYSDTRIVIADPKVANQTVTGLYVSNDPVGFSKAVALSLGLRAQVRDGEVLLTQ